MPARGEAVEHHAVAVGEPGLREREAAEAVAVVGIGAGEVDREVGPRAVDRARQHVRERAEVGVVAGAVVELDVDRARGACGTGKFWRPWIDSVNTSRRRRRSPRCRRPGARRGRRPARGGAAPSACIARAATAASLNTQKPSPKSRCAWCVPPARLTPMPASSALRQAASVAPAERRERSTIAGDHGKADAPQRALVERAARRPRRRTPGRARGRAPRRSRRSGTRMRSAATAATRSRSARVLAPSGSDGPAAAAGRSGRTRRSRALERLRAPSSSSSVCATSIRSRAQNSATARRTRGRRSRAPSGSAPPRARARACARPGRRPRSGEMPCAMQCSIAW